MTKPLLLALLLAATLLPSAAQPPMGAWRDHFAYSSGQHAAFGGKRFYVASGNGVFWFDPQSESIGKLSRVQGLSDVGISALSHSPHQELLLVGYENGNIDLVFPNRVANLPYILQRLMPGVKRINHFLFKDPNTVLVSTGFGIVEMHPHRTEFGDAYFIAEGGEPVNVYQTAIHNGQIYAATAQGLYTARADNPLLIHFGQWARVASHPNPEGVFTHVTPFAGRLFVVEQPPAPGPDVVWAFDGVGWARWFDGYSRIASLQANGERLVIASNQGIAVATSPHGPISHITSYPNLPHFRANHALPIPQGGLVVADGNYGMMLLRNGQWRLACPTGPLTDRAFFVNFANDQVLVAAGSRNQFFGNLYNPSTLHILSNERWISLLDLHSFDMQRVVPNPRNPSELFAATWGHGVSLFRDGQLVEQYNQHNSSLESIVEGPFCRVGGLAFDAQGNLWVSNQGVSSPISVRLADGSWVGFPYLEQMGNDRIADLVMSPQGHIWAPFSSRSGGIFVLDPGANPAVRGDDRHRKLMLTDRQGGLLPNIIHSLAFDHDGYMWAGTTDGVVVSFNPHQALEGQMVAQRILIPDVYEGLAVNLLDDQLVTAVAVDGGNRKWFGTAQSGAFLFSADAQEPLLHFTRENSPLPSNNIHHIGVHPATGEVFFATDRGLVSYRGDAAAPRERFGRITAFPNPVRPDFQGTITITGLVSNTIVRITDVSGNLVYETVSQGSYATWDGRNLNGNRVATGVYLIFCADPTGEQSAVGKLVFVR